MQVATETKIIYHNPVKQAEKTQVMDVTSREVVLDNTWNTYS